MLSPAYTTTSSTTFESSQSSVSIRPHRPSASVLASFLPKLELGGRAARQVYDTLELRRAIYDDVDRRTLVRMLALEKAGMASIADIIYAKVHMSEVQRWTRIPRHIIYCEAVRVLDRSPRPSTDIPISDRWNCLRLESKRSPRRFSPKLILHNLSLWRRRFPNLRTVLYKYPAEEVDDAYTIHIRQDKIHVDLDSRITYDPSSPPPSSTNNIPSLPLPPLPHDDLVVHQTITVRIYAACYDKMRKYHPDWISWLIDNPNFDKRISGIQFCQYFKLPLDKLVSFLRKRKDDPSCEAITDICLPISSYALSIPDIEARLEVAFEALGPTLRRVSITLPCINAGPFDEDDEVLPLHFFVKLDKLFLKLEELSILNWYRETIDGKRWPGDMGDTVTCSIPPLVGLKHLRLFTFTHEWYERPEDTDDEFLHNDEMLAKHLVGLGAQGCIYRNMTLASSRSRVFHEVMARISSEKRQKLSIDADWARYDLALGLTPWREISPSSPGTYATPW